MPLPEGKADAEGAEALAAALSVWLALAQPLVLALARLVAQMPSPLKSSGQPEALPCREAVTVALTEGLAVAQALAALLRVALPLTLGAAEAAPVEETLRVTEGAAEGVPRRWTSAAAPSEALGLPVPGPLADAEGVAEEDSEPEAEKLAVGEAQLQDEGLGDRERVTH